MAARKNTTPGQIINHLRIRRWSSRTGGRCGRCAADWGSASTPITAIRSDNGANSTANAVRDWLKSLGVRTLFIAPGSSWENGYNESFNGTLGEAVLKREISFTLTEAQVLIEQWRREYNTIRLDSSLGYRPPAPEAIRPDRWFLNLPSLRGPQPAASRSSN